MTTKWWCAVLAVALLGGCGKRETLNEWCFRNPRLGDAPPLVASSVFVEGTARTETPPRWAARMLAGGFLKVETSLSARADGPYLAAMPSEHHRSVLRFTRGKAGDPGCTMFDQLMRPSAEDLRAWNATLPADRCIALAFGEATSSEATLYYVDVPPSSPFAPKLGRDERRWEIELRDLPRNRVHARYRDAGYMAPTRSGSAWVSCPDRPDDAQRLADLVVPPGRGT